MRNFLTIAAGCALSACVTAPSQPSRDVGRAVATLFDGNGEQRGQAEIFLTEEGLAVDIRVYGVAPGVHAVHIHETGACEPPDFASAGGHWNPLGRDHGRESPSGQHMGDMPNIVVGQGGNGVIELTIDGAQMARGRTALLDEDGAAVVLHARPDDYRSQPSGAAGPRIACGVIEPAGF